LRDNGDMGIAEIIDMIASGEIATGETVTSDEGAQVEIKAAEFTITYHDMTVVYLRLNE